VAACRCRQDIQQVALTSTIINTDFISVAARQNSQDKYNPKCQLCGCQTHKPLKGPSNHSTAGRGQLIPKGVLKETIWTIEMLFPIKDEYDKKPFLRSKYPSEDERKHIYGDDVDLMDESPPEDLYQYYFWRDRLLELYEEYNAPPPNFFRRRDRKNPLAFYGFYLSLFLGCVSVVVGILVFGSMSAHNALKNLKSSPRISSVVTTQTMTLTVR
jgi:hypothetical protein